jgi:xanthine dehydrogenase D subunit
MTVGAPERIADPAGGIGDSARRPDGVLKVTGQFAYASDLWADGMIWGVTLRSPHPYARVTSIAVGRALVVAGVRAVLTGADVPGNNAYGLDTGDQPVLAAGLVRYQGEPVALIAADDPETARRAAARISVDYEVLEPVTEPQAALRSDAPSLHPQGNLVRHLRLRKGDPSPSAEVVVTGSYTVGMQDQAFLGPESGLAVPDGEGGVDLYVATQWLHADQRQVCAALGLPPEKVRLTLAGVGGAFGGREDISMHVHACMLALHTGRPVKMVYTREESFFGHPHRHPATMRYEHGAKPDGRLVYVRAEIILDGGAYASSTAAVVGNAGTLGAGPYAVPNLHIDAYGVYTNNPPCGAMRGFGTVQAAFGYEAQMDKLAATLGLDPVTVRCVNAMSMGSEAHTGQIIDSPAPVAEMLRRVRDMPLPGPAVPGPAVPGPAVPGPAVPGPAVPGPASPAPGRPDPRELPGGMAASTRGEGVVRGVGYAVGYKNVGFSEGYDDYSTARVSLRVSGGEPAVIVHTAAAEVGQGLLTVQQQICRAVLGIANVVVETADTRIGSAGSSSASRQTYVTGGAVKAACERVRDRVLALAGLRLGVPAADLSLRGGHVIRAADAAAIPLAELLGSEVFTETATWRHRPTRPVDPQTGQGFAHMQYAFAAHRAVVDVDTELGLVRVVELACAQDVGRAVNPDGVLGQIHGGSAQGLGLAIMEEIQISDGQILNPSFTDYLIPTILDMPPMQIDVLEYPDPNAPFGVRGVGEPPAISSGPAIAAAVRAATGLDLNRVPIRPWHITRTG